MRRNKICSFLEQVEFGYLTGFRSFCNLIKLKWISETFSESFRNKAQRKPDLQMKDKFKAKIEKSLLRTPNVYGYINLC